VCEQNAISKQQCSFLQGRSTSRNLLETLSNWTLSIEDKQSVVVAYIDLRPVHTVYMSTSTCIRYTLQVDVDMKTLSTTCRRRHVEAMFDLWKDSLTIFVIYLINIHEPPRSI